RLLAGSQLLNEDGERLDVVVVQLLQHGRVLRFRSDLGRNVGFGLPGELPVACDRRHVQRLTGGRVGPARRAVTTGAVLLVEGGTVGGQGRAGGGEEESGRERNRVAHRGLLSRRLIRGRLMLRKAPVRERWSTSSPIVAASARIPRKEKMIAVVTDGLAARPPGPLLGAPA